MNTQAMTELHGKISAAWASMLALAATCGATATACAAFDDFDSYALRCASQSCDDAAGDLLRRSQDSILDALGTSRASVDCGWFDANRGGRWRLMDTANLYNTTHIRVQLLDDNDDDIGGPVDVPLFGNVDAFVAAMASIHAMVTP